jgi:ribonuclease R
MKPEELILEYIASPDYLPIRADALIVTLAESDSEINTFARALAQLEKDCRLVVTKKHTVLPIEQSDLRRGIFRASTRGFGFVDCEINGREETFFIAPHHRNHCMHGDTVLCQIERLPHGPKNEGEARVRQILTRAHKTLVGSLEKKSFYQKKKKPSLKFIRDDRRFDDAIVDLNRSVPFAKGDKVELTITHYENDFSPTRGYISRSFGHADTVGANYEAILAQHEVPTVFSKEVLRQCERAAATPLCADGRLDLRNRDDYGVIFTIDGADAKDLDDAISIIRLENGNFRLSVHIADVSEYVPESSATDQEAFARGTSLYFVDQVVPMLPPALSNGACSLHPDVDRYTLSCVMELSPDGSLLHTEITPCILRTQIRGIYDEVNDLIEHREQSEFCEKYALLLQGKSGETPLDLALQLYRARKAKSHARGMLNLETVQAKILLDEDGNPCDIIKYQSGIAQEIIEQFMLLANEAVARFCEANALPCVYRIHEVPSEEKLNQFAQYAHHLALPITDFSCDPDKATPRQFQTVLEVAREKGMILPVSMVMLRSLSKAKYDAHRALHFGLGLTHYCHFTSPIRRYPDLSVHRILKDFLRGNWNEKRARHYASFAQKSAQASSQNELRALQAERAIEDLYKILFLLPQVGTEFTASVVSVTNFGIFVQLENTCEGLILASDLPFGSILDEDHAQARILGQLYRLADPIRVRLIDADVQTAKATFRFLPKKQSKEI